MSHGGVVAYDPSKSPCLRRGGPGTPWTGTLSSLMSCVYHEMAGWQLASSAVDIGQGVAARVAARGERLM
jgi:hypothetical protein